MHRSINTRRLKLLSSVSSAALLVFGYGAGGALAENTDRPTVWVEAGWHYEQFKGLGDGFSVAPFISNVDWSGAGIVGPNLQPVGFVSPLTAQNMPLFSYGADGKIVFQPEGSDWAFSAAVRFGRSHGQKHTHGQQSFLPYQVNGLLGLDHITPTIAAFSDTKASMTEMNAVVDFQVGKDVGLGFLGHASDSNLGFGIRYAQFRSKLDVDIHARPLITDTLLNFPPFLYDFPENKYFHSYAANAHAQRSFHGIGPSVSWNGTIPVIGSPEDGEVALDWGANAALLFGRQKVKTSHQTAGSYHHGAQGLYSTSYQNPVVNRSNQRSVTVPNLGGTAGLSLRYSNFKMTLGYRADFFFGAMDNGWDAKREATSGFYGPFASIGIGLGD